MKMNPLNLALRFLLEISALVIFGIWSWHQFTNWPRFPVAILIPAFAASVWGIFAVPDDPSRSGKTVIAVHGILRLLLEFSFFGFAIFALSQLNYFRLAIIYSLVILAHNLVSYKRNLWLLGKQYKK